MAANPALVQATGFLSPAPFQGEVLVLRRPGISIDLDNVLTAKGKWSAHGELFLSNYRLVFVAKAADVSGLQAFDIPLTFIVNEKFNQPIFGCNHLSGQVWPAVEGGGVGGSHPPHTFKLYFKEGGCGTFLPLFYGLLATARVHGRAQQAAAAQPQQPAKQSTVESMMNQAFVDANDPSVIFLTQPVAESERLPSSPPYAAATPAKPAVAGDTNAAVI